MAEGQTRDVKYTRQFQLKYGCNPQQDIAHIWSVEGKDLPFKILNGKPGYINLLDALNAWQLVSELRQSLKLPAAASFKHVSPAGAAVAVPLNEVLRETYEVGAKEYSPQATAYLRARNADPKSSFGDFAALSDRVDKQTALVIKTLVSDGIIAPGYEPEALEILCAKKGGRYIVLEADPNFETPDTEFREIHGVVFSQKRNKVLITEENSLQNIVTENKNISPEAKRDLILAAISLKYTQSNSVGFAVDGQMIGVGAGQQSRVDCVKLAGNKAAIWYLRQHPKVRALKFRKGVKKVARTNARIQYIEGDFTEPEKKEWLEIFEERDVDESSQRWKVNFSDEGCSRILLPDTRDPREPDPLTHSEKVEFLRTLKGVSLSSDAFFPFRDNIDQASRFGVSYILQPGGSVQDEAVVNACNDYGMAMAFNGIRLFHH